MEQSGHTLRGCDRLLRSVLDKLAPDRRTSPQQALRHVAASADSGTAGEHQLDYFPMSYEVAAIDLPGFNCSSKPANSLRFT